MERERRSHGCDQKWRRVFAGWCSAVPSSRTWQGAKRCLGAWQEAAPAGRGSAMQQSVICSVEKMNLENRKAGDPEVFRLRSCSGPAFLLSRFITQAGVFYRASATRCRLPRPPLLTAPELDAPAVRAAPIHEPPERVPGPQDWLGKDPSVDTWLSSTPSIGCTRWTPT